MVLLANLLGTLAYILNMVFGALIFLIIARAIISWVNPDPYNAIVRFLVATTDPFLRPLRKKVPLVAGGIDLAPLLLLFLIYALQYFLVNSLADYAAILRQSALRNQITHPSD